MFEIPRLIGVKDKNKCCENDKEPVSNVNIQDTDSLISIYN